MDAGHPASLELFISNTLYYLPEWLLACLALFSISVWGKRDRRQVSLIWQLWDFITSLCCWLRVWISEELPDYLWLPQACGLREALSCQMETAPGAALLSSAGCGSQPAVLGRQNAFHNPKGPALSLSAGQLWESSKFLYPDLCVKAMWLTMSDQSCHGPFLQGQLSSEST